MLENLFNFSLLFFIWNPDPSYFYLLCVPARALMYWMVFGFVYLVNEGSLSGFTIFIHVGDYFRSLFWEMAKVRSITRHQLRHISDVF